MEPSENKPEARTVPIGVRTSAWWGRRSTRPVGSVVDSVSRPLALWGESRIRVDVGKRGGSIFAEATLAVVCLGLIWRTTRFALNFPIWGDEAFVAVNLMLRDLRGLFRPLEYGQVAPPGFLLAEWGVCRVLGPSERALRLIPFLAGVASLLVFWRFCRRVADDRVALVAVAILAASPVCVRHANEVKPYALDLLISILLTVQTWSLQHTIGSTRRWLVLTLTAAVGLWFSYPAVFAVGAAGLLLLGQSFRAGRGKTRVLVCAYAAITLASWVSLMVLYASPQARAAAYMQDSVTWQNAFPPLRAIWRLPWWLLECHAGSMMSYPFGGPSFGSSATLLLVVVGIVAMTRTRRRLLALLLAPVPLALAAAAARGYPYGSSARTMLYLAPAIGLLAGEGTLALMRACLPRWAGFGGPMVLAVLLGAVPVVSMVIDVLVPYKSADDAINRRMARIVVADARPGERLLVFNGCTPPPDVPNLMIQRWLQQAAELRYDLLRVATGPIVWDPDPATIEPVTGRTRLIVHRPGWARFPQARLATLEAVLVAKLGPPRSTRKYPLDRFEDVEVWEFGR